MTSKCRDLPRKGAPNNAFSTNKKGSKKIWVPKNKIIFVANVINSRKDIVIIVLGQWLLTTHEKRKGVCSNA